MAISHEGAQRLAKLIFKKLKASGSAVQLSACQEALARDLGCSNWHDLVNRTSNGMRLPLSRQGREVVRSTVATLTGSTVEHSVNSTLGRSSGHIGLVANKTDVTEITRYLRINFPGNYRSIINIIAKLFHSGTSGNTAFDDLGLELFHLASECFHATNGSIWRTEDQQFLNDLINRDRLQTWLADISIVPAVRSAFTELLWYLDNKVYPGSDPTQSAAGHRQLGFIIMHVNWIYQQLNAFDPWIKNSTIDRYAPLALNAINGHIDSYTTTEDLSFERFYLRDSCPNPSAVQPISAGIFSKLRFGLSTWRSHLVGRLDLSAGSADRGLEFLEANDGGAAAIARVSEHLICGHSVIVEGRTGSGKTSFAEGIVDYVSNRNSFNSVVFFDGKRNEQQGDVHAIGDFEPLASPGRWRVFRPGVGGFTLEPNLWSEVRFALQMSYLCELSKRLHNGRRTLYVIDDVPERFASRIVAYFQKYTNNGLVFLVTRQRYRIGDLLDDQFENIQVAV